MKIRFYGRLADLMGQTITMEVADRCSVEEVKRLLATANPAAAEALGNQRVRACIGDSIVPDQHSVGPTDEIEFLAPVSGG